MSHRLHKRIFRQKYLPQKNHLKSLLNTSFIYIFINTHCPTLWHNLSFKFTNFFPQFTTVDQRNHLKTTKHGKLYPKLKKITQALLLMLLTFCKSDPSQCNSTSRQNSPIQPSCHYLLTNEAILISSEMLNFLNSLFYDRKYHLKPFRLQAAVKL